MEYLVDLCNLSKRDENFARSHEKINYSFVDLEPGAFFPPKNPTFSHWLLIRPYKAHNKWEEGREGSDTSLPYISVLRRVL